MHRVLITIAATAALAGCGGGGGGPDCGAVGNRAVELIRAEIRHEPDRDARDAMESMLGPLKDGIVSRCRHREWSDADRLCFVQAETMEEADVCAARAGTDDAEDGASLDGPNP
jgi:hypothetical protein